MSLITLQHAVGRNPLARLNAPADFTLGRQEHIAIVGCNGSGKTKLVDLLTGRTPLAEGSIAYDFGPDTAPRAYGNVVQLTFEDALGSVETPYYFQQRFNSQDRDESPYVWQVMGFDEARQRGDDLRAARDAERSHTPSIPSDVMPLLDEFGVRSLLEKRIVLLSSGEMRRLHLFRAMLRRPRVLVLDNPFIGLDAPMRDQLAQFLATLAAGGRVNLIVVQSMLDVVPEFITHVVRVDDGRVMARLSRTEYLAAWRDGLAFPRAVSTVADLPEVVAEPAADGTEVIAIRNLSLTLPEGRVLYGGLNWTVHCGERWALAGRNGAGKSTLLSLICADHPAAYACDISLFGRRRGTGESIWDVKRRIGFVSPEFHRAYRENRPAIDIVASGLHDTVGLYRRPKPDETQVCRQWMEVFGIGHLACRLFLSLSSGEQRLCLLARAFVKDPELLILDEPFHGLDTYRRDAVRDIIARWCRRPGKTLIMVSHYADELPAIIDRRLEL